MMTPTPRETTYLDTAMLLLVSQSNSHAFVTRPFFPLTREIDRVEFHDRCHCSAEVFACGPFAGERRPGDSDEGRPRRDAPTN